MAGRISFDIQNLQARLNTLNTNLKDTLQLIQQLSRLQPSETSATEEAKSPENDSETRADLTASIQEQLKLSEDDLELLRQDVADVDHVQSHTTGRNVRRMTNTGRDNESQRVVARCLVGCEKLNEDLRLTRTRFRRAQLTAKSSAERAVRRERTSYLSSLQAAAAATAMNSPSETAVDTDTSQSQEQKPKYTDLFAGRRPRPSPTPTSAVQDDILLTSSADVTSSLRRTHNLLQSEVSRSQFARETLAASNEALKELNERYFSFDDLLSQSRGLLGTLLRSQKSDTWYLETTCWLLLGVIIWLVFRRWVYGPFWWIFWMPLKLTFNLISGLGYITGAIGGKKAIEAVPLRDTTVIGTATGTLPSAVDTTPNLSTTEGLRNTAIAFRSPAGSLSESVGTMVESSSAGKPLASQPPAQQEGDVGQQAKERDRDAADGPQEVRRGDGQVLPNRDEVAQPRNPKKRMMEEPIGEQPAQDEKPAQGKSEL